MPCEIGSTVSRRTRTCFEGAPQGVSGVTGVAAPPAQTGHGGMAAPPLLRRPHACTLCAVLALQHQLASLHSSPLLQFL